jgi:predicted ArsR family transcriptional regulator
MASSLLGEGGVMRLGLGEFQISTLKAIHVNSQAATAEYVTQLLGTQIGRGVHLIQVQTTMARLRQKGLIVHTVLPVPPKKRGRPKHVYRCTEAGLAVLKVLKRME